MIKKGRWVITHADVLEEPYRRHLMPFIRDLDDTLARQNISGVSLGAEIAWGGVDQLVVHFFPIVQLNEGLLLMRTRVVYTARRPLAVALTIPLHAIETAHTTVNSLGL